MLSGSLVRYGSAGPQVAFLVGAAKARPAKAVVMVGGLTDGLLFAPYVERLSAELSRRGWLAVHASIQSSWQGYGTGSLDRDAADLRLLCQHLRTRHDVTGVVLLGHSTGCQDTVRYVQRYGPAASAGDHDSADPAPELLATILQAPVSDHEWLCQYPELLPSVRSARELVAAGRGDQVVGRLHVADNAPITAARLLSLYELGGDDDMFSEGLPREAVQRILGPVGARPCLLLVSGADECVPYQDAIPDRAAALKAAIGPSASVSIIPGAPHNLAGFEAEAATAVCAFLESFPNGSINT
ncbi:hypothetical protein PLESTB_001210500 [Pleodorina starrii]|uniref:Uncharacterized protein n=1 Tax=Pleodorina starrii TaxID=330485 RepID=A0A9W6F5K6_9CHLO|nr:hypothetical protein PLESTB_001210500 [Pleodorina starrii]GLC71289.1 hypothetical protein PLESTF_001099500 [Pleodorina starrii]